MQSTTQTQPLAPPREKRYLLTLAICVLWMLASCFTKTSMLAGILALGDPLALVLVMWAINDEAAQSRLLSARFKPYVSTLLSCGVTLFLASIAGLLIWPVILVLPFWTIYSLSIALNDPKQRVPRAIKFALWMLTIGAAMGVVAWKNAEERAVADQFVHSVELYRARNGTYPSVSRSASGRSDIVRPNGIHYDIYKDKPFLFYVDAMVPECQWFYDFDARHWTEDCI